MAEVFWRRMQLGLPFGDADARAVSAPLAPGDLQYVRHRRARRYLLRVNADGSVRVTIPRGGSRREASAFAARHRHWIEQHRARLTGRPLTGEEWRPLRARADIEIPARLLELAAENGVEASRVSVGNQRSRWGSCGRNGHISVNWRVMRMPAWVRDYVLIHELMHLRRLDHSPEYWALVKAACPTFEAARRWLRTDGRSL